MFSELLKYPKTFGPMNDGFAEWHKGRSKYCVWVVEPVDNHITERFSKAQSHLSPYLMPDYARKIHITLGQAGFWSEQRQHPDDYLLEDLRADIEKLQRCPWDTIRCQLRNTLISYAIAPGFEILDTEHHLLSLNQRLCRGTHDESFVYFPHITVGLYNGEWDTFMIAGKLAQFPSEANIDVTLDTIKLISYEPAISGGTLEDELVFDLPSNKVIASRHPV